MSGTCSTRVVEVNPGRDGDAVPGVIVVEGSGDPGDLLPKNHLQEPFFVPEISKPLFIHLVKGIESNAP